MKLVVFGASRGIGRFLTEFALAEGHQVTAVARNRSGLNLNHPLLNVLAGDVTNAAFVEQAIKGHEMVFCTVSSRDHRARATLKSVAARNITQAMNALSVRRLMFVSLWGVLDEKASNFLAAINLWGLKKAFPAAFEDSRRALDEIRKYDWEWTAVRPVRLTNGERTGHYRIALEGLPEGGFLISRADVADFMLKQASSDEYVHEIPAIAY
jgi:putative NADH-flavin reductase